MLTCRRVENHQRLIVVLDGANAGEIVPVAGGFQYWPQGKRSLAGDTFVSIIELKKSLES